MMIAAIGSRYQVVIPAEERRRVNLKPHDKVAVEVADDVIVIRPVDARRFRGIGRELGRTRKPVDYVRELREEWAQRP